MLAMSFRAFGAMMTCIPLDDGLRGFRADLGVRIGLLAGIHNHAHSLWFFTNTLGVRIV
jgi:hypothetical protein